MVSHIYDNSGLDLIAAQLRQLERKQPGTLRVEHANVPAKEAGEFLDVRDVATLLKCCTKTARAYPLPWKKVGRKRLVKRTDFDAFMRVNNG